MTSAEWEMWVRYSQDAQPANEAEAEAFERFRRSDERAWARYEVEQQAWDRYMRGQEPANDEQAHWIEIFRQAGEPPDPHWLEGYWKEKEACERYPGRQAAQDTLTSSSGSPDSVRNLRILATPCTRDRRTPRLRSGSKSRVQRTAGRCKPMRIWMRNPKQERDPRVSHLVKKADVWGT